MRDIFIISDTHFGHANILTFLNPDLTKLRPEFSCVEEMDETIVSNWNKTVGTNDIIYHLGDVFFNTGHKHLSRLNGRKRLVLGNHDDAKNQNLHTHFEKILVWRLFKEYNAILTHIPIDVSSFGKASYNIHGHIHCFDSPSKFHINACVEKHNYTPRHIEEFIPK